MTDRRDELDRPKDEGEARQEALERRKQELQSAWRRRHGGHGSGRAQDPPGKDPDGKEKR